MFRPLARKNKQLPDAECIDILVSEKRGVLSVLGDGDYPYGTPMNHYYCPDDGCIYFHCGRAGHRLDALRRHDKVSFCITDGGTRTDGDWAYTVRSVVVFGRIEIIDDLDTVVRIAAELCRKFPCSEEYICEEIARSARGTLLLKLHPEHICGKTVSES